MMAVPALSSQGKDLAKLTISTVVEVAGQKVMAASRSENTAREIIGLAAATGVVRAIQQRNAQRAAWFSLDDNRATFGLRGKVADTLAVSVQKRPNGRFVVDLTVVEAKCVAKSAEAAESKSSRQQTLSTMQVLRDSFADQSDPIARRAWGSDLLALLSLRPEFSRLLASREELAKFKGDLVRGRVEFSVQGRSVVVLHDDEAADNKIGGRIGSEDDMLVQHRIGQRALANLMAFLDDPASIDAVMIDDPLKRSREQSEPTVSWGPSKPAGVTTRELQEASPPSDSPIEVRQQSAEQPVTEAAVDEPTLDTSRDSYPKATAMPEDFRQALLRVAEQTDSSRHNAIDAEAVRQIARKLQAALMGYGIQAEFTTDKPFTATPNGVIVRFKGHDTLTVKKVSGRKDELKSTHAIDVVDAKSGLGEVSFYIARSDRQIVSLADVWLRAVWPEAIPDQLVSFLIGTREDNGAPLWLNLAGDFGSNSQHGPHTLIAGETGSGKGVLIQNLLLQLIAFNSPKNLQLYVIDPKLGADFFWISEAPHLVGGIVSSQEDAGAVLDGLVAEMERRYALITEARTVNIAEYNRKVPVSDRLPRIVVFHDEMADWMADSEDYRHMIQDKMTRIASKARAAGINVFLVTQRASKDAIPVGIRDNLNNRLCLKVASKAGSELALKIPGGELLLGRGHLAANLSGDRPEGGDYFTAQVPFATTEQLEALGREAIAYWTSRDRNPPG